MPPLKSWPEWIKGGMTAAFGGLVALLGMALTEGARRADADAAARMVKDHEPRIQALERDRAAADATAAANARADAEWRAYVKSTLDEMRGDLKVLRK